MGLGTLNSWRFQQPIARTRDHFRMAALQAFDPAALGQASACHHSHVAQGAAPPDRGIVFVSYVSHTDSYGMGVKRLQR
jgi:hypothetical protein